MSFPNTTINWWNDLNANRNWHALRSELKWVWPLHCYGFASLYTALSAITLFAVLRLRASVTSNPHFLFLNTFLLILSLSRALYLYLDPYGSENLFPSLLGKIIWDSGFACICSALALFQLGFIHQLNELKFNSSLVSNESCIFITITMHFCVIIISDILLVLQNSMKLMYTSINILFSIWIICICNAFLFRCFQLLNALANLKSNASANTKSNDSLNKDKCNLQLKHIKTNNANSDKKPELNLSKEVVTEENAAKPKIKITDENELTVSYASDNTPSQLNATDSGHSSHSGSLKRNESTSIYRQSPKFTKYNKYNSHKISRKNSNQSLSKVHKESELKNIEESIENRDKFNEKGKRSTPQHESDIYSQSQKNSNCNVFENLVKRIIVLMAFGLIVSLCQVVGVVGAHGWFAQFFYPIIFWFSFQTAYRSIELLLVFTTVSITAKSFHNFEFRPNFKQRSIRIN